MAVYKDKKRGTWYVSLYYTDWTGKQQRKLKRGFSTKKEAQDWERHFSLEKASSLDMTFGDFYKRYTDDVKPKLRENTWKSKEYVIELKILPYFKDLVMREITPRDVIAWQNEMRKCESQDGEKYKGTYLRKNKLSITKSYQRISGRDVITKPKTPKSVRMISMPENVALEMKDFLDSIYGIEPSDRIFVISKSYLHHEMDRGVKASGVKRIRLHDLRHSHVSLLIDMGFSAVAIGNRVGHESSDITYRYAHMMPSIQDDMAEALDEEWKEGFDVSEES